MKGNKLVTVLATAALLAGGPAMAGMQGQGPAPDKTKKKWEQMGYQKEKLGPEVVRKVQQALNDEGYSVGQVDGKMGKKTSSALVQFQEDMGIKPTGNLDNPTLFALGIQPKDGKSPGQQRQGEPQGGGSGGGTQ
ncbi:peptidoglycan-binding domain-containing protein [Thiohalorhabdus sp. Cl-TMA]|uniref:Peptidoglycan-binding protein n=1 Tax=Thiohalorhabdus methylotrophus TaxID=3242694 RepID=A0ABV4TY33_9GAMM